jgi:hypothetical protein
MPTFTLRDPEDARKMIAFIKDNAGEQARIGQPLVVTVEAYQAKRSPDQNRLYWSVLTEIAEAVESSKGSVSAKRLGTNTSDPSSAPKQESPTRSGSSQHHADDQTAICRLRHSCSGIRGATSFGVEFA